MRDSRPRLRDLAILVERELYVGRSAIERAGVWTLDAQLAAYAA